MIDWVSIGFIIGAYLLGIFVGNRFAKLKMADSIPRLLEIEKKLKSLEDKK